MSRRIVVLSLSFACLVLSGCAMGSLNGPPTPTLLPQISGTVHGGQQPVSGATIQLYAANMLADKGASSPLLTTAVTTDSSGNFIITGKYTCPTTNPPVYLVSTGGNPGLTGSVNNADIVLMASLGLCNTLTSSTYVVISEFSTVATVYFVAPFMQDATHIGASPTNPGGMVSYFTTSASFNNLPAGVTSSSVLFILEFNTFSDILAACVNTSGGASGDGSPCGKLLSLTGAADTATAALNMTQTPSNNASGLYALILGTPPFQPYFAAVPSDFSATVGYTLPFNVTAGTLDSNGRLWLYTGGYLYNTVTDISTDVQGVITVYDATTSSTVLTPLFTVSGGTGGLPGTGGLYFPDSMAADASGHVFAVNANNTISEFSSTGGAISPATGWSSGVTPTFTGTGTGDSYQDNSAQVGPIAIDALGNIWGKVPNSATNCYFELNSSGTVITPTTGTACATLGGSILGGAAVDGKGNAWAAFPSSGIDKVNSSGNVAATAPTSLGCFSTYLTTGETSYNTTNGLLYDNVHGQVWGFSDIGAGAISDGGSALFCDASSTTIPTIAPPASTTFTTGNPVSVNSLQMSSETLDGAGNFWFTTDGVSATGTATSPSTFTGTVKYTTWLGEISPAGVVLSPFNIGTGTYGSQPAGVGMNVSANVTNATIATDQPSVGLLGIDNAGNIWLSDEYTRRLIKVPGAVPNTVNY